MHLLTHPNVFRLHHSLPTLVNNLVAATDIGVVYSTHPLALEGAGLVLIIRKL